VTGTGSHLGQLTATYPHCVNFTANMFSGTATFTAANGDQLFVDLEGSAEDPTCTTDCAVTFTGAIADGMGRLEGAEGTLTGIGTVDLDPTTFTGTITAELQGTINKEPMPLRQPTEQLGWMAVHEVSGVRGRSRLVGCDALVHR
jgi:hypothetical protein